MLTGALPFGQGTRDVEFVRDSITNDAPDLSKVPEKYRELIQCCLQKNACDRPADVAILLQKIAGPTAGGDMPTQVRNES